MKKKMDIIKIQVPLYAEDEDGECEGEALMYNESGSVHYLSPMTPLLKEVMGDEPKKYFYFKVENKMILLDKEAPWQDW